jgi:N-acetylglucosamine-6-phosphate deacetylase
VLGIHLEGPHLAPEKRGVHDAARLRALNDDDLAWLTSLTDLKVVLTVAPEVVSREQIARLREAGIVISGGHSQASFEVTRQAIDAGLSGFTHLFNAMPALSAREPGILAAALTDRHTWAGIIADGHHVHPANIRLAVAAKSPERIMLVSDAMPTVGADSASFQLYGETITVHNGRLVNSEGRLAGSAIGMSDALAFCYRSVGLDLAECLRMASANPATFLGIDNQLGRLAAGYRADLVALDSELGVSASWVAGRRVYRRAD